MSASLNPDLIVADIERASKFYRAALGLEELDRMSGPEGPFFALLARDGFRIMIETPQSPDPTTRGLIERQGAKPRATVNLWVQVPSVSTEEARLRKASVSFHGPVAKPYGMTEVTFQDPDGYTWTLAEKTDGKK